MQFKFLAIATMEVEGSKFWNGYKCHKEKIMPEFFRGDRIISINQLLSSKNLLFLRLVTADEPVAASQETNRAHDIPVDALLLL